ncbi:exo-alpha-sialidase [Massilia sp. W12]|uniref:WD40/YVTN/BNR-like repeat-containing protein n=1 Tax=Massilia sp. W12 TaxID=3126507 RepID=UPI0030D4B591
MGARGLIASRKGLFELGKTSSGWKLDLIGFEADPVSIVMHDARDDSLYAALNLGHFGVKLHRRNAQGEWQEIATPAYPPQEHRPEGEVEWKLKQIFSMAPGGAPGELWAGTMPGGLFHSLDHGQNWRLVESLWNHPLRREWFGGGTEVPAMHAICVDPRDSRRLLLGISCGGAWRSDDGGESWRVSARGMRADYMPPQQAEVEHVQDPHMIKQCRAQPDAFWCQHHNGIWRSIDDAQTWQQIHPHHSSGEKISDFGFAVAVHPANPDCAWFAPAIADMRRIPPDAALSVSRTRDGGRSFESLRLGLPQEHCYDLIYRHGLAVADDGETLLMGSTTGGLWLSEDGGDTWQSISHTLPPIYAVDFYRSRP